MTSTADTKVARHLAIFYLGTMLLAIGGGIVIASGQEAGGLLFILSPLVMVLIVRFFLGDGWKDAGLRLHLRQHWGWYLFALLLYPILFPVVIGVNVALGFTTLTVTVSELVPLLLAGFAVQLVPRMVFALSEEWGWRGYLEPRLAQFGIPDLPRHLLVGILWGIWHLPLILSTDYASVPLAVFLPVFLVGTILLAIIFGQMRKASESVWPAVLLHGMGNALGYAIVEGNFIAFNNELLGNIVPGSITITLLYGLIALLLLRRTRVQKAHTSHATATVQPSK